MEILKSFIILFFALIFATTMHILIMINGWGVEPKSYTWIIVGGFISTFITQIFVEISKYVGDKK